MLRRALIALTAILASAPAFALGGLTAPVIPIGSGYTSGSYTLCSELAAYNDSGNLMPSNNGMSDATSTGSDAAGCPAVSSTLRTSGGGSHLPATVSLDTPISMIITDPDYVITAIADTTDRYGIQSLSVWVEGNPNTTFTVYPGPGKTVSKKTGAIGWPFIIQASQNGPATVCVIAKPYGGYDTRRCATYFFQNNPSGAGYVAIPKTASASSSLNYYMIGSTGSDTLCDGKTNVAYSAGVAPHCAWATDINGHLGSGVTTGTGGSGYTYYMSNNSYAVLNVNPSGGPYNFVQYPNTAYTNLTAPFTIRSTIPGVHWTWYQSTPSCNIGGPSLESCAIDANLVTLTDVHLDTGTLSIGVKRDTSSTRGNLIISQCEPSALAGESGTNELGVGTGTVNIVFTPSSSNSNVNLLECVGYTPQNQGNWHMMRNAEIHNAAYSWYWSDSHNNGDTVIGSNFINDNIAYQNYWQQTPTTPDAAASIADPSLISGCSSLPCDVTGTISVCFSSTDCAGTHGGTVTCNATYHCQVLPLAGYFPNGINPNVYLNATGNAYAEICWMSPAQGSYPTAARYTGPRGYNGAISFQVPQPGCESITTVAWVNSCNSGSGCYELIQNSGTSSWPSSGPSPVKGDYFTILKSIHPDCLFAGQNNFASTDSGNWNIYAQRMSVYSGGCNFISQAVQPQSRDTTHYLTTSGTQYALAAPGSSIPVGQWIWVRPTATTGMPHAEQARQVLVANNATDGSLGGQLSAAFSAPATQPLSVNGFSALMTTYSAYRTVLDGSTYFPSGIAAGSQVQLAFKMTAGATAMTVSICPTSGPTSHFCTSSPTVVTFNNGAASCVSGSCTNFASGNGDLQSDGVSFSMSSGSSLSVNIDTSTVSGPFYKSSVANVNGYECDGTSGSPQTSTGSNDLGCGSPTATTGRDIIESITVVPPAGTTLDINATNGDVNVKSIAIATNGSGYTDVSSATIAFSGGGSPTATATATANITADNNISVTAGGTLYTKVPIVSFTGQTCTATPTATAVLTSQSVTSINIVSGGTCKTLPTAVVITAASGDTTGSGATANPATGHLVAPTITSQGLFYTSAPTATISGGTYGSAGSLGTVTIGGPEWGHTPTTAIVCVLCTVYSSSVQATGWQWASTQGPWAYIQSTLVNINQTLQIQNCGSPTYVGPPACSTSSGNSWGPNITFLDDILPQFTVFYGPFAKTADGFTADTNVMGVSGLTSAGANIQQSAFGTNVLFNPNITYANPGPFNPSTYAPIAVANQSVYPSGLSTTAAGSAVLSGCTIEGYDNKLAKDPCNGSWLVGAQNTP